MSKEKESFIKQWGLISVIGLLGVIAIGGTTYIALPFTCLVWYTSQCHVISEQFGQVGDLFGGIANPIITFLALIALLYSIKIQKEELKKTSEALQKQNDYIAKQNFENTFFQMLNLWNNSTQSLTIKNSDIKGKELFSHHYSSHNSFLHTPFTSNQYNKKYDLEWNKINFFCGSYMIMLKEILRFIKSSNLTQTEKQNYANIIFAQCNSVERLYIFFFGLSVTHGQELKLLIEQYSGLKYLDTDIIKNQINPTNDFSTNAIFQSFIEQYLINAYGDNLGALNYHKDYTPPPSQ